MQSTCTYIITMYNVDDPDCLALMSLVLLNEVYTKVLMALDHDIIVATCMSFQIIMLVT